METPRPINKLLEIVLEQFEIGSFPGICVCIGYCWWVDYLTISEVTKLQYYMNKNKIDDSYSAYWWPKYARQPRIDWLKNHIKLTSK